MPTNRFFSSRVLAFASLGLLSAGAFAQFDSRRGDDRYQDDRYDYSRQNVDRDGRFGWRESSGRPDLSGRSGIYVWHEGRQFHIVSTSRFSRELGVHVDVKHGSLRRIAVRGDDRNDRAYRESRDRADFVLHTRNERDEIVFEVSGGDEVKISFDDRAGNDGRGPWGRTNDRRDDYRRDGGNWGRDDRGPRRDRDWDRSVYVGGRSLRSGRDTIVVRF